LKFAAGNNTKVRGDPGTNSIYIDVDYLSTTQGGRATYTSFIIQNNSTYSVPPVAQSLKLDAIVSDASLTLIGIDDLQISNLNLSPTCNVIFIGLSTITAAKFSTVYNQAVVQLSNLSTTVESLNNRQLNIQGVQYGQFYPVSSQTWAMSTTFANFIEYTYTPVQSAISAYIFQDTNNTITNSTNINSAYSTLSSYISKTSGLVGISALLLSTLVVNSYQSTIGSFAVGGQTSLNATSITNGLVADTVTSVFYGDGSHLTGISGGGGGISYLEFYPISTSIVQTSTLTTSFYSTLSSYIKSISFTIPPNLSTLYLSTGLLTASNISAAAISTNYGFFSTISAGTIFAKFVGDGSQLTGITGGGGISIVPPFLSTTTLSTGFLTASNISASVLSTNVVPM
jgi:hypothetical protein